MDAELKPCPFCGNAKMEIHHNTQAGITFLLCGDDRGRGGCGAVVSFRPNLTGSKAIQAYNRRAARADMAGEIERLTRGNIGYAQDNVNLIAAAPILLQELRGANTQMEMAAECIEAGRYDEALLHVRSMSRPRRAAIAAATGER